MLLGATLRHGAECVHVMSLLPDKKIHTSNARVTRPS